MLIRVVGLLAGRASAVLVGAAGVPRGAAADHPEEKAGVQGRRRSIRPLLWAAGSVLALAAFYRIGYWIASLPLGRPGVSLELLMGTGGAVAGYIVFGPAWARTEARYGRGTAWTASLAIAAAAARALLPIEAAAWMMICALPLSLVKLRSGDSIGPAVGTALAALIGPVWTL